MNNSLVDDKIKELFVSYRTIAIVGVSADTNKASNRVMKFLRNTGYKAVSYTHLTLPTILLV